MSVRPTNRQLWQQAWHMLRRHKTKMVDTGWSNQTGVLGWELWCYTCDMP